MPLTAKLSTSLPSGRSVRIIVADTIVSLSRSAFASRAVRRIATSVSPTATAFPPAINVVAKSFPRVVLSSPSKSSVGGSEGAGGGTGSVILIVTVAVSVPPLPSLMV